MALPRKTTALRALGADVLVISEAATPERLHRAGFVWDGPQQWVGDNENKGLLVLGAPNVGLRVHHTQFAAHHWMLPIVVDTQGTQVHLLAVWR